MDEYRVSISAQLLVEIDRQRAEEVQVSNEATVVNVGADIGNATSIVAVQVKGEKATVQKLPSAVGFNFALPPKLEKDDHVFYDQHGVPSLVVGMAALRYVDGETISGRGSQERYGDFMVDFIVAGIASQVKGDEIVVERLAVTVPAKYYTKVNDTVAKALRKTHTRNYRGRAITVTVKRVWVYREAEAALAQVADIAKGSSILIDGGGQQTHIALARDGVLRGEPVTRETGFQRVLDRTDDVISAVHGRRMTPLERYELEVALAAKGDYAITVNGKQEQVAKFAREKIDDVAGLVISDIQSIIPKWRNSQTIILGGGQAYHLAPLYQQAFPGIVVVKDRPEMWNALGALKLIGVAGEVA